MAFEIHGCHGRVQSCISEPTGSTPFKLPSSLRKNSNKLISASASSLGPFNVLAAAFTGSGPPPKVYRNKKVQDIIQTVLKIRLAAEENPCQYSLKARFLDIYKNDNHMACYNLCQQYKDYFAMARAKKLSRILFVAFFLQNHISFCRQ